MQVDLFPIRYSSKLTAKCAKQHISAIAAQYGLSRISVLNKTLSGIPEAVLAQLELEFWPLQAARDDLRKKGIIPLKANKIAALGRSIQIKVYSYGTRDRRILLTAEIATKNEYPAPGADIWLARRLTFFGGFIGINTESDKTPLSKANALSIDLRRGLGVTPRRTRPE